MLLLHAQVQTQIVDPLRILLVQLLLLFLPQVQGELLPAIETGRKLRRVDS
tara:strand:+ start:344 stop:496 length:153 start_codon:yes stop_codon:yes gene_type:complete